MPLRAVQKDEGRIQKDDGKAEGGKKDEGRRRKDER